MVFERESELMDVGAMKVMQLRQEYCMIVRLCEESRRAG